MRLLDQQLTTNELEPPMRSVDGWPVNVQLREPAVGLDRGLVTSKTELLVPITTKPEFMSPLGPSRRARDVSDMSG
jgi:hypothetical protein